MKKTISVFYEGEKLKALRLYMRQKELSLEEELAREVEGLYQKHVPANVRFFLEMKDSATPTVPSPPAVGGDDS